MIDDDENEMLNTLISKVANEPTEEEEEAIETEEEVVAESSTTETVKEPQPAQPSLEAKVKELEEIIKTKNLETKNDPNIEEKIEKIEKRKLEIDSAWNKVNAFMPQRPSLELRETDISQYVIELDNFNLAQEKLREIEKQQAELRQEAFNEYKVIAREEYKKVEKEWPEFGTDYQNVREKAEKLLKRYGFTAEDFSKISNSGTMFLIRDAIKYEEMMSKQENVKESAKKKIVRNEGGLTGSASTSNTSRLNRAFLRLASSGSDEDALTYITEKSTKK